VVHSLSAMLRFRMFAIACGYEDADDCDALRADPLFKLAVGRAPESGRDLCSQPTMSRLENAPSRSEVARMTAALVDLFCRSFPAPPATISHYGRTEAIAWCEANGVDYIFGLAGNAVLHRLAYEIADDVRVRRAEAGAERVRGFASFDYAAGSWDRERRVVARLEATPATSSPRSSTRMESFAASLYEVRWRWSSERRVHGSPTEESRCK